MDHLAAKLLFYLLKQQAHKRHASLHSAQVQRRLAVRRAPGSQQWQTGQGIVVELLDESWQHRTHFMYIAQLFQ